MIAASDAVEFVPCGRQQIKRHPGEVTSLSGKPQLHPESFLLHRLSQVAITKTEDCREFWKLRSNDVDGAECEEELYVKGKTAMLSRGDVSHTSGTKTDCRRVVCCYTCDSPIRHALWCKFYSHGGEKGRSDSDFYSSAQQEELPGAFTESICLVDSDYIRTFTVDGRDYTTALQFQISNVWPTKYGLLMERCVEVADASVAWGAANAGGPRPKLPYIFSLLHPLDDIVPVIAKHGRLSYLTEPTQQIVFTNEDPSICMIYNTKTHLHSVWKIRRVWPEERQTVGDVQQQSSMCVCSASASFSLQPGAASLSGNSASSKMHTPTTRAARGSPLLSASCLHCTILTNSSSNPGSSKSTFSHSRTSHIKSRSHGLFTRSHHSLSSCPSLLLSTPPSRLQGSTRQSQGWKSGLQKSMASDRRTPPPESRIMTGDIDEQPEEAKPLFPELCLEHLWTEGHGATKDKVDVAVGPASKVFISTDQVGQRYLCYFIPTLQVLCYTRMEKTNQQDLLVFGFTRNVAAKDAAPLPNLNMTAVVDVAGGVVLFSGPIMVGKVQVAGISTALTTSSYLAHFGSPFPKRSSLLLSSRPASALEPKFDEDVNLLSPVSVVGDHPARINVMMDGTLTELNGFALSTPRAGQIVSVRDAVGSRVTLEYSDGLLFRIKLPDLCSSPLVSLCLTTLKQILTKDLAVQVTVKWYAVRNGPGTQDISPAQEWLLFIGLLLELIGYDVGKLPVIHQSNTDDGDSPSAMTKKKRPSSSGTEEDWDYLLHSPHHQALSQTLTTILRLEPVGSSRASGAPSQKSRVNSNSLLFQTLPMMMFAFHLLYEDMKLNLLVADSVPLLAQLLYQLASDMRMDEYVHHYWKDFPLLCPVSPPKASQLWDQDLKRLARPPEFPPSIFQHVYETLMRRDGSPYPYIDLVNTRSRDIVKLTALLTFNARNLDYTLTMENFVKRVVIPGSRGDGPDTSVIDYRSIGHCPMPYRVILIMTQMGITRRDLHMLPAGVALLLNDVIYKCRAHPPLDWPEAAYSLLIRQDLASQVKRCSQPDSSEVQNSRYIPSQLPVPNTTGSLDDPRESTTGSRSIDQEQDERVDMLDTEILKLRFSKDHRVNEVQQLLQSSKPVSVCVVQRPEVSDHEFIEEQEKHLYALCARTMALPIGRGMFTLRSGTPVVTETLPIPRLCLTGRAPPRGTTVDLSHIEVVPNMNLWPLFHNGVAAGLRIRHTASDINSAWIVFNKPKGANDVPPEHAGFLMALGLNGHLNNLMDFNKYEYLVRLQEMTSVGLLLGIAATKRGTMDMAATKVMSIHIEALLPPTSIELDIPQNIQVAALLGVGLIYEGTAHRHIAEVLLSEIGRPPGPEMENSVDRESYSLAAGLALGLVVLGRGSKLSGLSDLALPDTLHYYMSGGNRRPLTGSQKEKYKSPSYQIREGDSVNIDVTSPGATLALGMMYFNSKNKAVADWMKAPDTQYLLDFVRPDFLMLRIIARSLILWDDILPSSRWVESNLPNAIRPYCLVKPRPGMPENVDYETMNQAYCNILAGACMALGLRFAGSANKAAFDTLLKYAKMFTSLSGKSIAELAGKSTIETCLNVIIVSLAMVMAGTGELEVLRMCRYLRSRVGPTSSVITYGSHLATHMALGLLFLGRGRYTLSTSPSAVAAMICAFFPKFPTHSNDNRYHLQAFRHLYVLAVEPRLLIPKDIDSGHLCYAHVTLVYLNTKHHKNQLVRMKAPCILPELDQLLQVKIDDDRYWPITFHRHQNWDQLENTLHKTGGFLDVKQRAGCLSYLEDPQGFRSLLAQMLTSSSVTAWSVPAQSIIAFSSDPSMVNFARIFLEQDNCNNRSETQLMQTLTSLVYECVTQDKLNILLICLTVLKALQSLHTGPCVFLTWQLKILSAHVLSTKDPPQAGDVTSLCSALEEIYKMQLVPSDLALSVQQIINSQLQKWEKDLLPTLKQYMCGNLQGSSHVSRKLASYLTLCGIPSPKQMAFVVTSTGERDPVNLYRRFQLYGFSAEMALKLSDILREDE